MTAENTTEGPWDEPYPSATGKVSLGAKDIEELAKRTAEIFQKKIGGLVTFKWHTSSYSAEDGEWGTLGTNSGQTATLPSVTTEDQLVAVTCGTEIADCFVEAGGTTKILWGGVAASIVTLYAGQAVLLQSDGTNWRVVAEAGAVSPSSMGSVSGATTISATTKLAELSATRPVRLSFIVEFEPSDTGAIYLKEAGEVIGLFSKGVASTESRMSWCGIIGPGKSIEWLYNGTLPSAKVTYRKQVL